MSIRKQINKSGAIPEVIGRGEFRAYVGPVWTLAPYFGTLRRGMTSMYLSCLQNIKCLELLPTIGQVMELSFFDFLDTLTSSYTATFPDLFRALIEHNGCTSNDA